MTYDYIVNPVNGKKIKINTKQGEAIIEKYRKEYNKKQQGGKPKNPFFPRVPASILAWSHDQFFNLTPFKLNQNLSIENLPCTIANNIRNFQGFGYNPHIIQSNPTLKSLLCSHFSHSHTDSMFGSSHISQKVFIQEKDDSLYKRPYEFKTITLSEKTKDNKSKEYNSLLERYSKNAFHKDWKMVQRYKQILYANSGYVTNIMTISNHITNFFGDKDAHLIIKEYFNKLYTADLKNPEYRKFKEYFYNVAINTREEDIETYSLLSKKYWLAMEYAEQLSFKVYLDSIIPRNCLNSKGIRKKTKPEIFEKSERYTLNNNIKKIPHNYLRMYLSTFCSRGFFIKYHKYCTDLAKELDKKKSEEKTYAKFGALHSVAKKTPLHNKTNKKKELLKKQLKTYNELKLANKIPGSSIFITNFEIDDKMPFSDQNIRDMEQIFYESGTFYNMRNHKNIHITRFDERVWKLFWQLGHEHGINDINIYNSSSFAEDTDKQKKKYIDFMAAYNFTFNAVKAAVGVVASVATAVSGALGDLAKNVIEINSDNLGNYTTALLKKKFLFGKKSDIDNKFAIDEIVTLNNGVKGKIISSQASADKSKIKYQVVIKGVPQEIYAKHIMNKEKYNMMSYYEIAHFAGYYYALADNFYYRVTDNERSKGICEAFRHLSKVLN